LIGRRGRPGQDLRRAVVAQAGLAHGIEKYRGQGWDIIRCVGAYAGWRDAHGNDGLQAELIKPVFPP
jgi:hypothetical protein